MRSIGTGILAAALGLLVGCGWPQTNEERAAWFFDEGEEWILEALEDVDATQTQMDAAREILAAHEAEVTGGVESFFDAHREVLRTLASGAGVEALLAEEATLSEQHREALRRIGTMHESLGDTVGERTWAEARARMRDRIDERLED